MMDVKASANQSYMYSFAVLLGRDLAVALNLSLSKSTFTILYQMPKFI